MPCSLAYSLKFDSRRGIEGHRPDGFPCAALDGARRQYRRPNKHFAYFGDFLCCKSDWNNCVGECVSDRLDAVEVVLCLRPENIKCISNADSCRERAHGRLEAKKLLVLSLLDDEAAPNSVQQRHIDIGRKHKGGSAFVLLLGNL